MPLNTLLLALLILTAVIAAVLWMLAGMLDRKPWIRVRLPSKSIDITWHKRMLRMSYMSFNRIPLLRIRLRSMRDSLFPIYGYQEWQLREKTALFFWGYLIVWGAVGSCLIWFDQDWISILMLVLVLSVVESLYLDLVLQRADMKLLHQSIHWFGHVRHAYQRHRIVELAIEETLDLASPYIRPHTERLLTCITEPDEEEALTRYDEAAPNRYYRMFARLSRLVMEHGDPQDDERSSYLRGVSMIIREMRTEYMMRYKLDTMMKGLKAIAVIPVLFANPIEQWARDYFPMMNSFYDSKLGMMTRLLVFITVIASLRLLHELQWRKSVSNSSVRIGYKRKMIASLYDRQVLLKVVRFWMSRSSRYGLLRQRQLLREANSSLSLERWTSMRLIYGCMGLLLMLITAIAVPFTSTASYLRTHEIWLSVESRTSPTAVAWQVPVTSDGKLTESDQQLLLHYQQWVSQMPKTALDDQAKHDYLMFEIQHAYPSWSEWKQSEVASHLIHVAEGLDRAGWQGWELLLPLLGALLGYYAPVAVMQLKKRLIAMDVRIEVSQYVALVLILRSFERMTIEQVIEWLAKSAIITRSALQRCLLNWESGAEDALAMLKKEHPHPDFIRFIEKLELGYERIPLRQAFDDAEQQWHYEQELRKEMEQNTINTKSVWGQWIGFAPMYAIVFMYLVLPLVWLSAEQMNQSFSQIQTLS